MHIIEAIKALVLLYWLDAVVVVAFIAVMAFLYKRGQKEAVKRIVYDLVVKAEATLGSGTGDLKYNRVVAQVYAALPFVVRLLFTQKDIDRLIAWAVDELKQYLGQGKNLLTYDQEQWLSNLPPEEVPSNAELNNIP